MGTKAKKESIEREYGKRLDDVDIVDLAAKEKVLAWYRKEIEENQARYEHALKSLFSGLALMAID